MAYLAFQELGGAAAAKRAIEPAIAQPAHDPAPTRGRLSPLEWSVVALARRDRLSSLGHPSRMAIAMRAVFKQHNPRLADERLEALRRAAVLTWHHGYVVPSHEVDAFLAAGFTADQYEAMADSIGVARAGNQRR